MESLSSWKPQLKKKKGSKTFVLKEINRFHPHTARSYIHHQHFHLHNHQMYGISSMSSNKNDGKNKRNSNNNGNDCTAPTPPVANYSNIRDPLPQPPSGLSWHRNEDTREWTLVDSSTILGHGHGSDVNANVHVDIDKERIKRRTNSLCSYTSSITTDVPESYYNNNQQENHHHLPPTHPHPRRRSINNNKNYGLGAGAGAGVGISTITVSVPEDVLDMNISNHLNPSFNSSSSTLGSDDLLSYAIMNANDCAASTATSSSGSGSSNVSLKGDEYSMIEHIILPNDTLQGICIQYKVSATRLRQVNQFSGSNLLFAPKRLLIPIKRGNAGALRSSDSVDVYDHVCTSGIKLQDTTTHEYKIHKVLSECSSLRMNEIQAYLELHNWNVDESIDAAKADIEWEKSQSGSLGDEYKSSIEPPPTSCYRVTNDDMNVNVRLTQRKEIGKETVVDAADKTSANLLELKAVRDAAERWEELSCPNSYKSCIDNSEKLPLLVVGTPIHAKNDISQAACFEDYQKAPPIDYGIEMKDMSSIVSSHPAVVTVTR